MKIPKSTLSATQLRRYGTGGFTLEEHEAEKGCPRQYKARYVDGLQETGPKPYPLVYGGLFHDVMFKMEEHGMTPDEALAAAFEPGMPQAMWTEAREDLDNYLARGATPSDRFGTVAVEAELKALLYVDEDYGPTYYRGFIDLIGIDLELPRVMHLLDYKTNRLPPKQEDLTGDVQLRGYHWLLLQNHEKWMQEEPRIVTHLDVVKYRDVEVVYSRQEIDDWHSWAVAVARKIWRDEDAEPVLNEGCAFCYVQDSCPAFNALPTLAETLAKEGHALEDPVKRLAWSDRANKIRLLLEKSVKTIQDEFKQTAMKAGSLQVGDVEFVSETEFKNVVDVRLLRELLGDDEFYAAVAASKAAVERATKGLDPSERSKVLEKAVQQQINGTKVTRKKVTAKG